MERLTANGIVRKLSKELLGQDVKFFRIKPMQQPIPLQGDRNPGHVG